MKMCFFCWGHVELVVLLYFFVWATSLGPKPCFFVGLFLCVCVFFVGGGGVGFFLLFCFENDFQCLPFFLLRLPLSLSLSLSLSFLLLLFFISSLFSFVWLSCFTACPSCLVLLLLLHGMNFRSCLSYLVSLLLFHGMNNFEI